jgi:hypothetical protein
VSNTHWRRRIERADGKTQDEEGYMDDFQKLVGNGLAQVEMNTQFSLDYGAVKVSSSVRITCNQDEATINEAGKVAFFKSMELTKDGMGYAIPTKDETLAVIAASRYSGG